MMDIDAQVITMDWFPVAKGSQEVLAVGCADGSLKLLSKTGRIEKYSGIFRDAQTMR